MIINEGDKGYNSENDELSLQKIKNISDHEGYESDESLLSDSEILGLSDDDSADY